MACAGGVTTSALHPAWRNFGEPRHGRFQLTVPIDDLALDFTMVDPPVRIDQSHRIRAPVHADARANREQRATDAGSAVATRFELHASAMCACNWASVVSRPEAAAKSCAADARRSIAHPAHAEPPRPQWNHECPLRDAHPDQSAACRLIAHMLERRGYSLHAGIERAAVTPISMVTARCFN